MRCILQNGHVTGEGDSPMIEAQWAREFADVLVGIESLTLHYRDVGRRVVAETLLINAAGQVTKGMAQWSIMDPLS
jgi:hypothetical protein